MKERMGEYGYRAKITGGSEKANHQEALRKFCVDQFCIRCTFLQFSCVFQDILQQFKSILPEHQIFFPGILIVITFTMAVMVSRSVSGN